MRAIFGLVIVPFEWAWSMLERRIWLSMIGLAALAGAAYMVKQPTVTCVLVAIIAILLMRVDSVEAQAAARAE